MEGKVLGDLCFGRQYRSASHSRRSYLFWLSWNIMNWFPCFSVCLLSLPFASWNQLIMF
jgi:hypothetical protein